MKIKTYGQKNNLSRLVFGIKKVFRQRKGFVLSGMGATKQWKKENRRLFE